MYSQNQTQRHRFWTTRMIWPPVPWQWKGRRIAVNPGLGEYFTRKRILEETHNALLHRRLCLFRAHIALGLVSSFALRILALLLARVFLLFGSLLLWLGRVRALVVSVLASRRKDYCELRSQIISISIHTHR